MSLFAVKVTETVAVTRDVMFKLPPEVRTTVAGSIPPVTSRSPVDSTTNVPVEADLPPPMVQEAPVYRAYTSVAALNVQLS